MAGKKRFLKLGGFIASLGIVVCLLLWWRLPDVLNVVGNQQLKKRGFEGAQVTISTADSKHLNITHAELNGSGWEIELDGSMVRFGWLELFRQKKIDSVEIESLRLSVNPAQLDKNENPLTVDILERVPIRNLNVAHGVLELTLDSGIFQINWSGELSISKEKIVTFTLTSLSVEGSAPDGSPLLNIPKLYNPEGLIQASLAVNESTAGVQIRMVNFGARGVAWQISESSLIVDLVFQNLNLMGLDLADTNALANLLAESVSGTIDTSANQLVAGAMSAQWLSSQIVFTSGSSSQPINSTITASLGTLTTAEETIEQLTAKIETYGDLTKLQSTGEIDFLYQGIEGRVNLEQTVKDVLLELSLNGEYNATPMKFEYSDIIGRKVSTLDDLLFSGSVSASGDYHYSSEDFDLSSTLALTNGSISIPSSNLEATGIRAKFAPTSLTDFTSDPGQTALTIDLLKLGDLEFENTQLQFDVLDAQSISLTHGSTQFFDGTVRLSPTVFSLNPTSFETAVAFEKLSLKAIVDGMHLFNGTMGGTISGHLPVSFKHGRFQTNDGYLALSEGETARLKYNTEGMFEPSEPTKKGFLASIGDKILNKLKLAPENVVEDALSNLTIHELRIDILPEDSPNTPARIHLTGEGLTGTTIVPMILDTNINGTTDELLEFLIRIHSLGTPSFQ